MPKLYNTIAIYDVYVVAESDEEAQAALQAWRATNAPSETVVVEVRREVSIREAWCVQKPLVANDVSDEDFEKIKGKTTAEIYRELYTKNLSPK